MFAEHMYLLHGNLDPGQGCLVSFRALKEAAVSPQDLILIIPGHPAERFVDIHQRAVGQIWVSNGYTLQSKRKCKHRITDIYSRLASWPTVHLSLVGENQVRGPPQFGGVPR